MNESALVDKIRKALHKRGAKTLKIHGSGYQEAGTPDIVGCYEGKCFAIEVKRDAKHKATALQLKRLDEWCDAGARTGVVWTVDMALNLVTKDYQFIWEKNNDLLSQRHLDDE